MNTVSCLKKVAQHWRAFGRAEDGNVAVIFALSLIPLVGLIGGAIDYSRASAVRSAMQTAVDATALAMSKEAPDKTATQLQTEAEKYFNALFDQSDASGIKVNATFIKNPNQKVVIDASADVTSYFMRVWPFNITEIPVGVSSTTVWGNTRLRIALALDNTGSMAAQKKMVRLKEGMDIFINRLAGTSSKKGDVYVSVVPFSQDVNVGKSNRSENWIRWSYWDDKNGSCSKSWSKNKKNCEANGGKWTPADHSTWNGCVMDRNQNEDISNQAPDPEKISTLFPAHQYNRCPSEMIALKDLETNEAVQDLKDEVQEMHPAGYTNITIGLAWAWQSLTPTEPLNAPPLDPNYEYQKVLILLTDGENTRNRFSGRTRQIDKRTKNICEAIKDDGIIVYTILVMEGNKTLLENCASEVKGDRKYTFAKSADEIVEALDEISIELMQLRVAM